MFSWNKFPQEIIKSWYLLFWTEYMCFNQIGDISTLNGSSLKLVDKFTFLGSSVSSIETDINTRLAKAWTTTIGYRSYGSQTWPMKWNAVFSKQRSILRYGCTTWTLTKRMEKKLDLNYTRMLRAILNKSRRQHPTKHQLYGHLPPITKTTQVRWTRHAGHCWRCRDELISNVLLCTPSHGRAKAGRLVRTHIKELCVDTGCSLEDLPKGKGGGRGSGISVLMAWHDDYLQFRKHTFYKILLGELIFLVIQYINI